MWYLGFGRNREGALHLSNLSRLSGTRSVSLKITTVCKPFQGFRDRLDNQFVVFGLGRNGGGASLHHTNLSRLTGTRFVSLKLASFANRFRDFRIGWTTVLWCWGLGGRGALHHANLSGLTWTRFVSVEIAPIRKPF